MGEARRHRSLLIIFIIILILHSMILWIFFMTSFDHSHKGIMSPLKAQDAAQEQKNNPALNPNTWKALQAKPSAPVIFKNPQTVLNTSTPTASIEQKTDLTHESLVQEKPNNSTIDKPLITDTQGRVPIAMPQEKGDEPKPDIPLINTPKASAPEKAEKKEPQKTTSPAGPKKFSFNTLAQGFAQHMHDQGNDEYTMRGAQKGKATAEQLKYAQYGSKICNTITNAFVTNKRKLLFTSYAKHDAIIKLVINRDGSLKEALVLKSSTVPSIDLSIITVIKEAAEGFPPLPEFFAMNDFPLTIMFNNAMQIIEHPEQSYWSL